MEERAKGPEVLVERLRLGRGLLAGASVTAFSVTTAALQKRNDAVFAGTLLVASLVLGVLVVRDVEDQVLPDRWTGALAVIVVVGLVLSGVGGGGAAMGRGMLGALALGLIYLTLVLSSGGQGMGLGDAKLAPGLGGLTGWLGWSTWCLGTMLTFLLAAGWGMCLLVRGHGRSARMPFGPFMIVGSLLALVMA